MSINLFKTNPVIAAVRKSYEFERALSSPTRAIFLLSSDILTLEKRIKESKICNKKVFIHVDFCDGISKDKYGLEFLKRMGAEGIISTKTNVILAAKELNFLTVQRFFIIDSLSINTALDTVRKNLPDFVEIMPGIMPSVIKSFASKLRIPIIAGGLIQTQAQAVNSLKSGATAVSTSEHSIWQTVVDD